jgi:hypothetical protein
VLSLCSPPQTKRLAPVDVTQRFSGVVSHSIGFAKCYPSSARHGHRWPLELSYYATPPRLQPIAAGGTSSFQCRVQVQLLLSILLQKRPFFDHCPGRPMKSRRCQPREPVIAKLRVAPIFQVRAERGIIEVTELTIMANTSGSMFGSMKGIFTLLL